MDCFRRATAASATTAVAISGSTTATVALTNVAIAATGVPTGLTAGADSYIAAFWDDLWPGSASSSTTIYYDNGVASPGVLIIQWKDEYHYLSPNPSGNVDHLPVQVFSSPAAGAPWIQILYPDATFGGPNAANDNGASATVGYVDGTNAMALNNAQWSFNTASIPDGTVISIFPPDFIGVGGRDAADRFRRRIHALHRRGVGIDQPAHAPGRRRRHPRSELDRRQRDADHV